MSGEHALASDIIDQSVEAESGTPPPRRGRTVGYRDDLGGGKALVGADLGTAEGAMAWAQWWAQHVQELTGTDFAPSAMAVYLAGASAYLAHLSDASGHGLRRGWHVKDAGSGLRRPWTSDRERKCWRVVAQQACWPNLGFDQVPRPQRQSLTRLVLGTDTTPGLCDMIRLAGAGNGYQPDERTLCSWATAIDGCDPRVATEPDEAARRRRDKNVRRQVHQHLTEVHGPIAIEIDYETARSLLISAA